jgi:hypothetical protein
MMIVSRNTLNNFKSLFTFTGALLIAMNARINN